MLFKVLFFVSLTLIVYMYVGYILFIAVFAGIRDRKVAKRHILPPVTILTVVHNEERVIETKIKNCLALDYPKTKLKIMFVSDGSTDDTVKILSKYQGTGILFYEHKMQRGKIAVLNEAVFRTWGEIILFSDADILLNSDALSKLVSNFNESLVGGVCGSHQILDADNPIGFGEKLHFKIDNFIKEKESRIASMVAPWCGTYAIRRELFLPVDEGVNDDFFISLGVVKQGYRFVFEPEALCYAIPSCSNCKDEIARRIRNTQASLRTLYSMKELLNPFHYGCYSILLFSHKLLRRLIPFFIITLFISNLFILHASSLFCKFFLMLCGFHLLVLLGVYGRKENKLFWKTISIPFYFYIGNLGTLMGVISFLKGEKKILWTPIRTFTQT